MPQLSTLPQPSPIWPQLAPAPAQVMGVQALPQWLAVPPPPQICGDVQVPQVMEPPQPSGTEPQLSPAGHVVAGVHVLELHEPALQLRPDVQVPHDTTPPHPSDA